MHALRSPILAAALAAVLVPAGLAVAKDSRAPLTVVPGTVLEGARARIRAKVKSHGREELRVEVQRAATGLDLEAWFEDATGTMTLGGALRPDNDTPGEYRFRVRTDKGGVMPAGAANLAELAGRDVQIRDGGGTVTAQGIVPAAPSRSSSSGGGSGSGGSGSSGSGSGSGGSGRGGHDDGANHD